MNDALKQAILKIGGESYKNGSDGAFEIIIDAINERSSEMKDWTPDMYVAFIKEIQKAINVGFGVGLEMGLKKYGQ